MTRLATYAIAPDTTARAYFVEVFGWMAAALAVTGGVSAAVGHDQRVLNAASCSTWTPSRQAQTSSATRR